jgi:hypothetical protein
VAQNTWISCDVWVIFGVDIVCGTPVKETGLQAENTDVLSA